MLFILHSQFSSLMSQSVFPRHQMSILSSLSDRKAQSLAPLLIFSAPHYLWHNSCNICICRAVPYRTTSWALHLSRQKRYNFDRSLSSSILEFYFTYFSLFQSYSLTSSHPTQLQLAAESHRMVCQLVRVSMKDTASKRVGLQHGWVLTSRPKMLPFSVRILSAMS